MDIIGLIKLVGVFALLHARPSATQSINQQVVVNTARGIQQVSDKFLSVAFGSGLLQEKWEHFDFSSSRVFTLARGLAPAFVRFGGTAECWLHYKTNQDVTYQSGLQHKNFTDFNITSADIDRIHYISSKSGWKVLFGLNVCLRGTGGSWNYSNPLQIIKYAATKQYDFGWELGNEPNHLGKFNRSINPRVLGKDFLTLRKLLDEHKEFGNILVGPDITRPKKQSMDFLMQFLSVAVDAVHAITWHQYYFNSRTCKLSDFYDPEILDYLLDQLLLLNSVLQDVAPNKRHWLGETATAWGGGAKGFSDRYVATLSWLDKLGLGARLGVEVVMKQTFFHGSYALVDDQLNPTPNYWLSLLHKRLVGQPVLDVKDSLKENRIVRVYAHCTQTTTGYPKGAVTIMVINVSPSQDALVSLSGSLQDAGRVDQYLLTADNANLTSNFVLLNGIRLVMTDDDTLPTFHPVTMETKRHLRVPSLALGFFVIPQANARACKL